MTISDEKKVDIALKYLDLARAEILYRIKSSNDTLIAYAGASGAIVAWLYKANSDIQGQASWDAVSLNRFSELLFPAGVVISFLSLVASWIVFHNERMVTALANYQRNELEPFLSENEIISWECSRSLRDGDPRGLSLLTSLIYASLLVGPGFVACGEMWLLVCKFDKPKFYPSVASTTTFIATWFLILMIRDRWKLRPGQEADRVPKKKDSGPGTSP
jgi:hypothetical protein